MGITRRIISPVITWEIREKYKNAPVKPGRLACKEMRMLDGATPYFSESFWTTGFLRRGAPSDPSGEYAVTEIPCFLHFSTISSCMHDLSVRQGKLP